MKRVLIAMIQPPGCSGVQALIYNKLLPFFECSDWEFHFAGPRPELVSVLTEELNYPVERLHYTSNVSLSLQFSIKKNRYPKKTFIRFFFGCLQLLARTAEKFARHNSDTFFLRGLEATIRDADRKLQFDLIAGKSPDFKVLNLVRDYTKAEKRPFFAMIVDPYGAREQHGFYPTEPELQKAIIDQSCGVLFMSPLTMDRYIALGLASRDKAGYFTDAYPEIPHLYLKNRSQLATHWAHPAVSAPLRLIYLGMLPEWRPIDAFLDAFKAYLHAENVDQSMSLDLFGFVYPEARTRIQADHDLSRAIRIHPMASYGESHWLAEDLDVQLVVIGPRHSDNYPSKFFEYLGHHKPILVLGPMENPLRQIVEKLGIGLYVDGRKADDILDALRTIRADYASFKQAYLTQQEAIEAFSAHRVAEEFCKTLDHSLANYHKARSL